ncbi:NADH-quinone oxidoreductase subunit A [Uliginosibacterium sediminicola]
MSSSLTVGTMVIKTPAIAGVFPKSVYLECEGKMLENYFPVLLFIILGVVIGVVPVVLGWFVAPHRPDAEKNSPYECGFEAFEDARMKFDVRYYLIAILFILFDLEVAFLLPWASILKEIAASNSLRLFGFIEMFVFLAVLVIGYVYVWKKGALDWE